MKNSTKSKKKYLFALLWWICDYVRVLLKSMSFIEKMCMFHSNSAFFLKKFVTLVFFL